MRRDAWTDDHDNILVNTIIKYARVGRTKQQAYREVAGTIGRTARACAFRWNSVLSKDYSKEIKAAELERLESTDYTNLRRPCNSDYSGINTVAVRPMDEQLWINIDRVGAVTTLNIYKEKPPGVISTNLSPNTGLILSLDALPAGDLNK